MELSSISLMSRAGDEVIVQWDPEDPKQVKKAQKAFNDLRNKGCIIYEVENEVKTVQTQKKGKQITEFPKKKASRLLARPAMSGG